jgi:four helix bundle protein
LAIGDWRLAIGDWRLAIGPCCRVKECTTTNEQPNQGTTVPKYQHFEELPVWQEAARLYNRVLDLLEEPGVPLSSGFRNQLDRSALSVSNNIAEGFERVTTRELRAFLVMCRGSSGEVRSMMAVVKDRPALRRFVTRL